MLKLNETSKLAAAALLNKLHNNNNTMSLCCFNFSLHFQHLSYSLVSICCRHVDISLFQFSPSIFVLSICEQMFLSCFPNIIPAVNFCIRSSFLNPEFSSRCSSCPSTCVQSSHMSCPSPVRTCYHLQYVFLLLFILNPFISFSVPYCFP